jgi:hypothetical protein
MQGAATFLPGTRRVSALVSAYASEAHIRGCLQDLVEQTLFRSGQMEIIVVDSGSPEGERGVVLGFQREHPDAIVYLRTARETIYAAWNRAALASRGRYLVNANADDRHRPDAFAVLADALEAGGEALAYCDALLTERPNETFAAHTARREWRLPAYNARQALVDCPFGCTVMWRRSLHAALGLFEESFRIVGDYEFFLKASLHGGARHVRQALTLYLESPSSLSYESSRKVEEEANRFIVPLRRALPLQRIYPFLASDGSPMARAAAAVDFGCLLLDPFVCRTSPAEALDLFGQARDQVGALPEIRFDTAMALCDLGRVDEGKAILVGLAQSDPAFLDRLLGGQAARGARPLARLAHPGLATLPPIVPVADTRIPFVPSSPEVRTHAPVSDP